MFQEIRQRAHPPLFITQIFVPCIWPSGPSLSKVPALVRVAAAYRSATAIWQHTLAAAATAASSSSSATFSSSDPAASAGSASASAASASASVPRVPALLVVVPDTAPLDRICRALTTQGLRVAPAHRGLLAPLPGRAPFALHEVAAAAAAASTGPFVSASGATSADAPLSHTGGSNPFAAFDRAYASADAEDDALYGESTRDASVEVMSQVNTTLAGYESLVASTMSKPWWQSFVFHRTHQTIWCVLLCFQKLCGGK